jgi:hypothetical protein
MLTTLWTHHNATQFQWPSIILSTVFVAASLLVSSVTSAKLVDTEQWGVDPEVKYGAAVPLLLIGTGTMAMLYTMARSRKIMEQLEVELEQIDGSFRKLNHPKGPSGAKLIWRFMAIIAIVTIVLASLFFCGVTWYLLVPLSITMPPWCALCLYGAK